MVRTREPQFTWQLPRVQKRSSMDVAYPSRETVTLTRVLSSSNPRVPSSAMQ